MFILHRFLKLMSACLPFYSIRTPAACSNSLSLIVDGDEIKCGNGKYSKLRKCDPDFSRNFIHPR